jgi:hypothetical protein
MSLLCGVRLAWLRFLRLETKYDRRILLALMLSGAYAAGWLALGSG